MNNKFDDIEDIDWCDYPYIGIGKKPISTKKQKSAYKQLKRIILYE